MRRRLALLAVAIAALVLVAFLVPLAVLVRTVAADRAVHAAALQAQSLVPLVATADKGTLRLTLEQLNANAGHPFTVFSAGGPVLGAPAARTAAVRLAATGRSFTVATAGGRQILVSVQGPGGASRAADHPPAHPPRSVNNRPRKTLGFMKPSESSPSSLRTPLESAQLCAR